jgi:hypothetical protein
MWSYLSGQQNGMRRLADYATIQMLLTGPRRARWQGRLQATQRFLIDVEGVGVIPANLYFVSLRGNVYRGIDARAELSVARQHEQSQSADGPYQSTALLDIFLKPRSSWLITGNIRQFKYSDRLDFFHNDRYNYGLVANYFARQYFNMGLELRRTTFTTGTRQQNTSVVLNTNFTMRNRANLIFSYGFNEVEFQNRTHPLVTDPSDQANTLNLQCLVWITRRGSISLNYAKVSRDDGNNTSFLGLNYKQDF